MHEHEPKLKKRVPLWKWLVIILIIVAMPFFFSFYRDVQLQQAINYANQP